MALLWAPKHSFSKSQITISSLVIWLIWVMFDRKFEIHIKLCISVYTEDLTVFRPLLKKNIVLQIDYCCGFCPKRFTEIFTYLKLIDIFKKSHLLLYLCCSPERFLERNHGSFQKWQQINHFAEKQPKLENMTYFVIFWFDQSSFWTKM